MKKVYLLIASLFILSGTFFYQSSKFNDGKLHIVFCDVGQGDAIYIRTPEKSDILIDSGPDSKVLSCLENNMPFWDKEIDLAVLTHPHADHAAGFKKVLESYSVDNFAISSLSKKYLEKQFASYLKAGETKEKIILKEDKIKFKDGVEIKVLWPEKDFLSSDLNQDSLVLLVSYKSVKFLLTGDAGAQVLSDIESETGKVDVLKIPHHGSKTGISGQELSVFSPNLAIISVGKNNYGHPSSLTTKLLEDRKINYFRTDQSGSVNLNSNGEQIVKEEQ